MEQIPIEGGKDTVELRTDGVIHLIWKPKASLEVADTQAARQR